jgi:hypothetical protein
MEPINYTLYFAAYDAKWGSCVGNKHAHGIVSAITLFRIQKGISPLFVQACGNTGRPTGNVRLLFAVP